MKIFFCGQGWRADYPQLCPQVRCPRVLARFACVVGILTGGKKAYEKENSLFWGFQYLGV